MPRQLRMVGYVMMGLGVLVLLAYVFDPLMLVWRWFRLMPVPLQIGLGIAGVGLAILMVSLLLERLRDDADETGLRSE